jgi:hypothetical protein
MPNGHRRGGQYRTASGKTAYRRGTTIKGRYDRWGMGGTDLAGLGAFLTVCEVILATCGKACQGLWRVGKALWDMDADDPFTPQRPAKAKARKPPTPAQRKAAAQQPLTIRLTQDTASGWRAGDVWCRVHHNQYMGGCAGCKAAVQQQKRVNQERGEW